MYAGFFKFSMSDTTETFNNFKKKFTRSSTATNHYTLFYISIELIFLSKYFSCCRNIVLMKISKKPNLSKRLRALMKCNGKGHWILSKVHNIKAHVQSNWKIRIKEILILDLDSTCASKVGALRAPYFIHDWIWF